MVCDKCKEKLTPLNTSAVWKEGATNTVESGSTRSHNKLLAKKRAVREEPSTRRCQLCKTPLSDAAQHYCQECAYKNGICSMCGRQVLDTTMYKMSSK